MRKTFVGLTAVTVFGVSLLCQPLFHAASGRIGVTTAWADDDFTYSDEEMQFYLNGEKNLANYNMLTGMLTTLLKLQRKAFDARNKGENPVETQVEDLLNDSNMSASQGDWDAAFVNLKTVHDVLKDSLAKMGITPIK